MDNVIGVDVGFGFTKSSNGKDWTIFKSIIGEYTDIQFQSDFEENSFLNNLHVQIENESYFIGDLAEKQSTVRQFTLDQETLIAEYLKPLALTATGLCAGDNVTVNLISGLPVGNYKKDGKKFKDILTGYHNLAFFKPGGKKENKILHINNVKLLPQPLGSYFNLLFDDKGKIRNHRLAKQKVGIVDIGFRTTDFIIFDNLHYIERGSSTVHIGISKCFNHIANKLRQRSGVSIELFQLYDAVAKGVIRIKGKEYNITGIRDKIYSHYASTLANDINRLWDQDWDIESIVLTGGGSKELAKHIQPLIEGNIIPVEESTDVRLNNVQGYLKYGLYETSKRRSQTFAQDSQRQDAAQKQEDESKEKEADNKGGVWKKKQAQAD